MENDDVQIGQIFFAIKSFNVDIFVLLIVSVVVYQKLNKANYHLRDYDMQSLNLLLICFDQNLAG